MTDYLIKQFVKCTNAYAQHVINSTRPLAKHRHGKNKEIEQGRNEKVFSSSFTYGFCINVFLQKFLVKIIYIL